MDQELEELPPLAEETDFTQNNSRISEMFAQVTTGDAVGFGENLMEATTFDRDDAMLWALIMVFIIRAITGLIHRIGTAFRPVIEVGAEKWKERGREKTRDQKDEQE